MTSPQTPSESEVEAEVEAPRWWSWRRILIPAVVLVALLVSVGSMIFVFDQTAEQPDSRSQTCRDRGGIFVNNGRYGDPFCVKGGRIITVWKRYGPVENP